MPIKKRKKRASIRLENVGPISEAKVDLGDLTVLVGPQASGKSVFLQTLKLAADRNHVLGVFEQQNVVFNGDPAAVINGFYGRGMAGMLNNSPHVTWEGQRYELQALTKFKKPKSSQIERLFYIPAQRVVSLPSGVSQTFGSFNFGDPYVLRYFAHQVHILLQNEFGSNAQLFPAKGRLNESLKGPIAENLFGGAQLTVEPKDFTKTLTLEIEGLSDGLPFLAWSAGQREFVPLLLGLYWLCPAGKVSKRDNIEWVVIEEPEMGLHPRAVSTFLLLVLELLKRGYKVVISTHSTVVLDLIWALRQVQECGGKESDVRELFELNSNPTTKQIAESSLGKDYRVYFFERGKAAQDISSLDPGSEDEAIANWGDLNGFAGRSADVVAKAVTRANARASKK
ncbi:AAA family ATPase [Sulfitobacter sp. G21635-S1]|uniref:AAA family ATPase n=1 Tax=Sulfitobacter sp. G21635-S1 TaxID=3014043 RepID=UPI0022AEF070|nr:ATP-binding protein [Sulfitobacter sp. G21635-S1]MCZ4254679.1 AAA family ATPase [Sulfitobacter sp. G21635-S1]